MFHREKKQKGAFTKQARDLITIVAPAHALADVKREDLVQKIKTTMAWDSAQFESFGLSLLHNLINHCQSLPETAHSYYASSWGLLDHALNRTEAALNIFRQYIIQDNESLTSEQSLWLYVLFSASLLQGVGKLQIEYKVDLFDVCEQYLKPWNPLLENLTSSCAHFYYQFEQNQDNDLRKHINLLLARLILPNGAFSWIASTPETLATWLFLLHEDWESAGTLGAILIRAEAISIQRYWNEWLARNAARGRLHRMTTFTDTLPATSNEREQWLGIEFIQWLTQNLENGTIVVNKAPLFMVPGGMLMSAELFKWFVRENPEYKNWQAVQHAFLSLSVHQSGLSEDNMVRFEQANTQQILSGVVFTHYAIALPEKIQVQQTSTGTVHSMSAVEFIHAAQSSQNDFAGKKKSLLHLTEAGTWRALESSLSSQAGFTRSG